MKGNNEFVYFLVVGLMILAILLAAFSAYVGTCTSDRCPENKTRNLGIIEAVKVFYIPAFAASDVLQANSIDLGDKELKNGLLFGEEKITYELRKSGLQAASVKFTVLSNNDIGKLIISVNGKIIESRVFDPGDYEISIDSSMLSEKAVIEVFPESSFWRIWAPNLYKLSDVTVNYASFENDFSQFRFYLGEEYLNLQFSKIDLNMTENVGTLVVDINGINVWESPVADLQSIRLDKSDLRLGDNIITFKAGDNSMFSGSAAVVVVFLAQFPETINQTGVVTAMQPYTGMTVY